MFWFMRKAKILCTMNTENISGYKEGQASDFCGREVMKDIKMDEYIDKELNSHIESYL